ncbi:MAG: hypothetical protein CO171_03295, partial [Syntrophobacterales bacterium CG_4_9_14_3_um_filter_49_8]
MSTEKPWYTTVKLPPGKFHQLDTDLDKLFAGLEDVGIGPRYVGEIRKGQWYAELGGPKHEYKSYIFVEVAKNSEEVVDGRVEIIGPELDELAPETSLPFAAHIKTWGPQLPDDLLEFVERGAVMGFLFTEGWGLVGARTNMWLRVSKEVKPRMSWLKMAQIMRANMISLCPLVEKVEIKWVVATPEVGGKDLVSKMLDEVLPKWEAIDARTKQIGDEDVDNFYGCTICKMIAPNHACIVTPSLIPYCGVMSYFTAKAMYAVDPYGYVFEIPAGDIIDLLSGRYSGVDEAIWERSDHRHRIFHLYSVIKYPTTNCGCFEATAFYIPQVDGIGI